MQSTIPPQHEGEGDEESELDLGIVRDYVGYALRALRLRPFLVAAVFLVTVSATYGLLCSLPRKYHIESRLLAQREAGVGHASRPDPLKGAAELITSHDNLALLVKQLDLPRHWREHLAPIQRFKAALLKPISAERTEEEQARILTSMLETKMSAWQSDNTVTITIDWPDGPMGARIVDTTEQNFLEQRHVMEIATVAENVSILEAHAAKMRDALERTLREGPQLTREKLATADAKADASPDASAKPSGHVVARRLGPDPELTRLKVIIDAKQQAISDLEQYRQRRVLDLQTSLVEQRTKYTEAHPVIVGIQQNIASFSRESPQVAALRSEVKGLQERYDQGLRADGEGAGKLIALGPGAVPLPPGAAGQGDFTRLLLALRGKDTAAESQVSNAVDKYLEIQAQINAARIELDLAQASFRYRYTVVTPAEPPVGALSPKVGFTMGVASVVGLFLGIVAAVIAEIRLGRFVGRWQVERMLKLPVLAELRLP